MVFDYTFAISPDDINYWNRYYDGNAPATIKGHVDVVVPFKKKVPITLGPILTAF